MEKYSVFPEKPVADAGPIAHTFLDLEISSFLEACRYVHDLPYGYNSDRDDLMILFKESMGSCTTKHAVIATLAKEVGLPINKNVGIYAMTEEIVEGAGKIIDKYGLPYVPMLHCFLVYGDHRVDLTEGNNNGKRRSIEDFLYTQEVIANVSARDEYLLYRKALKNHILNREELKGIDLKRILHAREEGLALLKANITEQHQERQGHQIKMNIFNQPSENSVKKLLSSSNLNSSDLTTEHLRHFFGLGTREKLEGVVGLELFDNVGLLRSLAVVSSRRRAGLGSKLLAYAEDYARNHGIKSLYLLTVTAENFFIHRGYQRARRDGAPFAIRETKEFSEICPVSSVFMVKHLQM